MNDFTRLMQEGRRTEYSVNMTRPLLLGDGTMLSIQASTIHRCTPVENLEDYSQYEEFEIGFPSVQIEEIMQYIHRYREDQEPTECVYHRVPKQVIIDLIAARGGVCGCVYE